MFPSSTGGSRVPGAWHRLTPCSWSGTLDQEDVYSDSGFPESQPQTLSTSNDFQLRVYKLGDSRMNSEGVKRHGLMPCQYGRGSKRALRCPGGKYCQPLDFSEELTRCMEKEGRQAS